MLNAVKCTIATFFFLLLVPFRAHVWRVAVHTGVTDASAPADRPARMDMLVLSAFLGITIGDIVWLHALKALGARRLILVDSLKPFVGALVAWLLLGERIKSESALAVLVTMAGVLLVALQRHHSSPQSDDIELLQRDAAGPYNSGPRTRCLKCGALTEAQIGTALPAARSSSRVPLPPYRICPNSEDRPCVRCRLFCSILVRMSRRDTLGPSGAVEL